MANMMLLYYKTARVCFIMNSMPSPYSSNVLAAVDELDKREAKKKIFEQESAKFKGRGEFPIQQC